MGVTKMRPLVILFFSNCPLTTASGVPVSLKATARELRQRGHEVIIFAPGRWGKRDDEPHIRYPAIPNLKKPDWPWSMPRLGFRANRVLAKIEADICHFHHPFGVGWHGLREAKRRGIATVFQHHADYQSYTDATVKTGRIAKWVMNEVVNFCDQVDSIIAPSTPTAEMIRDYGISDDRKIEVIPTGVNLTDFNETMSRGEIEHQWGITATHILLYVGRVVAVKNIDLLLEAAENLRAFRKDFQLLMVGDGDIAFYRKKADRLGLGSLVVFTDRLPKKVANRLFGAADLFVFPSITDTQGMVITEAQAARTPVIAVARGGPIEMIAHGKDGILVPYSDLDPKLTAHQIALETNGLLSNPTRRREMGRAGRAKVEKYLTIQMTTERLVRHYYETIKQHNSHSS